MSPLSTSESTATEVSIVELSTMDTRFAVGQGALLFCLGFALSVIGSYMATPEIVPFAYPASLVLTGLCLFLLVATVGIRIVLNKKWRQPSFFRYLWAATASVAAWSLLWILRPAPVNLLAIVTAILGIYVSLWYLRLAQQRRSSLLRVSTLSLLGVTTSVLGLFIATESSLTRTSAVTATSCYILWMSSEILLTAFYLAWSRRNRGRRLAAQPQSRRESHSPAKLAGRMSFPQSSHRAV